jgi:hypothetical protein
MGGEEECVWRAMVSMNHLLQGMRIIEEWVAARHIVDREKAKKFWDKGKREEACKILQHMIMAESFVLALKKKTGETSGDLHCVALSMEELQDIVQGGRNDSDQSWIGLTWSEVETSYIARITAIKYASST